MKELIDVFKNLKQHILAGVSYLIPVVVVGGTFTGLGVAFGGTTVWENVGTFPAFLFTLGKAGLNLMPAVIAAYIGYSISDKPALAPGFLVGQIAQDCGAGFLGGVLGGIFCGIIILYMKKLKVGKNFSALYTIIIMPCVATLLGAILMNYAVGGLVTALISWLTTFVQSLGTGNMLILGLAIGVIGSFDLGLFGSKAQGAVFLAMLSTIDPSTGLPVMIAQRLLLTGCCASTIPPLVCAVATIVRPKIFTTEEREAGHAAGFLGLFAITEGAIPLALADVKVWAGCIFGAMIGCATNLLLGAGSVVNWGGIPAMAGCTNIPLYVVSVFIGAIAGATLIIAIKHQPSENKEITNEELKVSKKGKEFDLDF